MAVQKNCSNSTCVVTLCLLFVYLFVFLIICYKRNKRYMFAYTHILHFNISGFAQYY